MTVPVVLLAGGLGTRLREETEIKPKPMIEIGGHPILWHIMKSYSKYGFNEFVVCLGYKGDMIKDFFLNYRARQGGLSIDLATGRYDMHAAEANESWKVHLVETGHSTMTGGRIKRAVEFLGPRRFLATYGDGLCDVNILKLLEFHETNRHQATITAVRPPARFGGLTLDQDRIVDFTEKPQFGEGWINGGFMVFEPGIVNLVHDDSVTLEREPLEALAKKGQLGAYRHDGFWQCMDTVRDLTLLRELWDGGSPPWKIW